MHLHLCRDQRRRVLCADMCTNACCAYKLSRTGTVVAVSLKEECICNFLCIFHGNASFFKVTLEVRPCVLVETSESRRGEKTFHLKHYLIHHGSLNSFPICSGRIFRNPHKTVSHHFEFGFACRICALCSFLSTSFTVSLNKKHSAVTGDYSSLIEDILLNICAHKITVMFVHPCLCFITDSLVSCVNNLFITCDKMTCGKGNNTHTTAVNIT